MSDGADSAPATKVARFRRFARTVSSARAEAFRIGAAGAGLRPQQKTGETPSKRAALRMARSRPTKAIPAIVATKPAQPAPLPRVRFGLASDVSVKPDQAATITQAAQRWEAAPSSCGGAAAR